MKWEGSKNQLSPLFPKKIFLKFSEKKQKTKKNRSSDCTVEKKCKTSFLIYTNSICEFGKIWRGQLPNFAGEKFEVIGGVSKNTFFVKSSIKRCIFKENCTNLLTFFSFNYKKGSSLLL